MTDAPLLSIENVRSVYGDTVALHDVSFDIADGEFFALLGPSGCGKTTLLRSIAGFETPSAGRILLDGTDLLPVPPHRRPVNMMFQSYALFPHMSVAKNIAYGLENDGLGRAEIRARTDEVMHTVRLDHLASRRPAQLSGGQRQRVALARAIVKRPRVLLLDEPLSALDRQVRASMQLELKRLQREAGMTFVIVTHDQEEAMSMADRIAVLSDGRVEQLAAPRDLYDAPATRFVASFIGTANLLDGTAVAGGVDVDGFGEVPASHDLPAAQAATVVIRPEHVHVRAVDGWRGRVVDAAFLGGVTMLSLDVPGLAAVLLAAVPGSDAPREGEDVVFRITRATAVHRDPADPPAQGTFLPTTALPIA